jgi:hypothetical protein
LMAVQNEKPRLQGGPQAGQKSQVREPAGLIRIELAKSGGLTRSCC